MVSGRRRRLAWFGAALAALALACLVGACNTSQTYVPSAVVILNPTPGQPSIYNAEIIQGGQWPGAGPPGGLPPYKPCRPWYPCHPMPPAPDTCAFYHKVRRGDTVSGLALRFRTTVWAITTINRLPNPNLIYAGTVLCIPAPAPWPTPGPWPTKTPWLTPTRVPTRTPTTTSTPTPTATTVVIPTITPGPPGYCAPPYYVVREGDTLPYIADICRTSVPALIAANPWLGPPYALAPGQVLRIPNPF